LRIGDAYADTDANCNANTDSGSYTYPDTDAYSSADTSAGRNADCRRLARNLGRWSILRSESHGSG